MRIISTVGPVALALALPAAAQAGPVTVDLSGLRDGGTLYVQVQTRAQFGGQERVAGRIIQAPHAGSLSVDLGEVAAGEYAVTVWHDDNGNHQFDLDPRTGAPLDGWAIAHPEGLQGPPTFERASVAIPAAGAHVQLTVHYGR